MPLKSRRSSRRYARGFSLIETMIGIVLTSLVIGAGIAGVIGGISKTHAPNPTNDGLQTAQNVATELEALAAYDPNFLSSIRSGQTFQVQPSYALTPKGVGASGLPPITVTVTGVTPPPSDGYTRSLGIVSIKFTVDGKTQSANVPIAAIAPAAESNCNPAAGVAGGCIVQ